MDIVDQAQEAEALFSAVARNALRNSSTALPAQGICYNCQDAVHGRDRFCDAECRDDYTLRKNAEARLGLSRR